MSSDFFFAVLGTNTQKHLLLTSGEVLFFIHLADGSGVVFQLADPLLCLFELVLQVLLQKKQNTTGLHPL